MIDNKWWALALLGALGVAVGCGEDEPISGGSAGTAGASGTGGSAGSGGSSGNGGAGGSAGSTGGAGGSAGSGGGDGGPDPGLLLVTGTDFFTATEVAAIDLSSGAVSANIPLGDGDVLPVASGGRGFVLERTNDVVHVLTATGAIDQSIPVGGADGGSTPANPNGVALVSPSRAFVTLYGRNSIAIVDPAAGSVTQSIDLSAFLDIGDGDGVVEVATPVHDPSSNRVYVTLARIDRTTIKPPKFELDCPTVPALLLAFDGASGAIVDLNGATAGEAIPLGLHNPVDVAFDAAGGRLFVLAAGCFAAAEGGTARTGHGVASVELSSGQTAIALTPSDASFFSRLIYTGSDAALIDRFDESFTEHWNRWTTSQSSLGAELSGVPSAPSFDGAGSLYGAAFETSDAGSSASIVRYDLASETATPVVSNPWNGSFASSGGSALVK